MRRIKAGLLLACAMSLVTALAVPAFAGAANWKKGGTEYKVQQWQWSEGTLPLAEPASVGLEGTFGFEGELGGVTCTAKVNSTLELEYALGVISKFELSNCSTTGVLELIGCTVSSATPNGSKWIQYPGSPGGSLKVFTGPVSITYQLDGGMCGEYEELQETTVYGDRFAGTPDKKRPISSLALSGSLKSTFGEVEVSGALNMSPSSKYGLMGKGVVGVSGPFSVSVPEMGTLSCQTSGSLLIEPGSTGELLSLSPSGCEVSGAIFSGCWKASVTSNALPWSAVNEGSSIKVKNLDLTVKYSEPCKWSSGGWSSVKGDLVLTPNNSSAISSTSLSGSLTFSGFNAETSGSWSWSPAGVFGL